MHRLRSLLDNLRDKFPEDSYLRDHDTKIRESIVLRRIHDSYERALAALPLDAWEALREKAMRNFTPRESDRGKQALYDHLNEALAYRFLLRCGAEKISFVDDAEMQTRKGVKVKCPDLRFQEDGVVRYCEVKTINVSDDQLVREKSFGVVFDSSVFDLHEPFFAKLKYTVQRALSQFENFGGYGLIFVLLHSDDRALGDVKRQKAQIARFMKVEFRDIEMCVKFGVYGRRYYQVRAS